MNGQRDDDFEAYLSGSSGVSRRYAQMTSEEPPAELDNEILEAARQAVNPTVVPIKASPRRWMKPVTLAATIVLSFSLVMSILFDLSLLIQQPDVASEQAVEQKGAAETSAREPKADAPVADAALKPGPVAAPAAQPDTPMAQFGRARPDDGSVAQKKELDDAIGPEQTELGTLRSAPRPSISLRAESDTTALATSLRDLIASTSGATEGASRFRELDELVVPSRSKTSAEAEVADARAGATDAATADELAAVMALFDAGNDAAALEALAAFAEQRPDHPASRLYSDWSAGR